jgi:hypothetical protein
VRDEEWRGAASEATAACLMDGLAVIRCGDKIFIDLDISSAGHLVKLLFGYSGFYIWTKPIKYLHDIITSVSSWAVDHENTKRSRLFKQLHQARLLYHNISSNLSST